MRRSSQTSTASPDRLRTNWSFTGHTTLERFYGTPTNSRMPFQVTAVHSTREYEIQPRKHHRGVDFFCDVPPFGHLWYGGPKAVGNAIAYARHHSRSRHSVIRGLRHRCNVIETHDHAGEFKEWWRSTAFTDYSAPPAALVYSIQAVR